MESSKTKIFTSMLDRASSSARKHIVSGAEVLAKGINKTSELVKKNTLTKTEKKIAALPHLEKASQTASKIVSASHKILGKVAHKTMEKAEEVWYSMPESELMKKISQDERFQLGLELSKAGASASINLLGGVSEGLIIVKDSGVDATVGMIQHKYGRDSAKVTKLGFALAGNLLGAYQLTYATGLIGISASEVMRIKEEAAKIDLIFKCLTRNSI